MHFVGSYYVAM